MKKILLLVFFLVLLLAHSLVRVSAADGLVMALSFDENSGSSLNDVSGNNNNGTISGATWSTSGKYGSALNFDGTNDIVNINDANSLDLTNGMTLEAWINPASISNWRTVLLKEKSNGLVYSLYANNHLNRPDVEISGIGITSGSSQIPLNTWTHVAGTYDGTSLKLYVNGNMVSNNYSGSISTSSNPLRIGGNTIWGEYFQGLIDEVRIYNRALTQAEIESDMNTPINTSLPTNTPTPTGNLTSTPTPTPTPGGTLSSLVASYSFNQNSGTSLPDGTGNNNNGSISGATWNGSGKYGSALNFDGTNDRVNINDSNSLDLTNGMTLEAWIYPLSISSWRTILLKEKSGNHTYSLYANNHLNKPDIEVNQVGFTSGVSQIQLNTWTHLAGTYDGSTLRLYINGNLVSNNSITGSIQVSSGSLRIGGNAIWGEYFRGLIDEVRIYNKALTENEIEADMSTPL